MLSTHTMPGLPRENRMRREAAVQAAVVGTPQGNQLAAFVLHRPRQRGQPRSFQPAAPDMNASRLSGEVPVLFADLQFSLPAASPPACTNPRDKAE